MGEDRCVSFQSPNDHRAVVVRSGTWLWNSVITFGGCSDHKLPYTDCYYLCWSLCYSNCKSALQQKNLEPNGKLLTIHLHIATFLLLCCLTLSGEFLVLFSPHFCIWTLILCYVWILSFNEKAIPNKMWRNGHFRSFCFGNVVIIKCEIYNHYKSPFHYTTTT